MHASGGVGTYTRGYYGTYTNAKKIHKSQCIHSDWLVNRYCEASVTMIKLYRHNFEHNSYV